MSDSKEWVTIKIPKRIRDDAQADPRTYGEIMADGLDEEYREQTIDVEDARILAQHVERALSPYFADLAGVNDASDIRQLAEAIKTIEEQTGNLERQLEGLQR